MIERVWWQVVVLQVLVLYGATAVAASLKIDIGLLTQVEEDHVPLSLLEPVIEDTGFEGADQGIRDNNTTGRFTGQEFKLDSVEITSEDSPKDAFRRLHAQGVRLFLINLPPEQLLALAQTEEAADSLLFNVGASDDALRTEQCRANVLHTAPSRAMLADALAQYLAWKRWTRWFLVVGQARGDQAFAQSVKRAGKRFGAKIAEDKAWTFEAGARRTDSGHVNEQQAVNAFSQVDDYDILLVADERDVFGEYLNYRTYRARPLGGTQGLVATAWSPVHEQWGATQFQRRFHKHTGRWMTPRLPVSFLRRCLTRLAVWMGGLSRKWPESRARPGGRWLLSSKTSTGNEATPRQPARWASS